MYSFLSNGATIIIGVLLILAIAYRYYSAFLAAKVLALDGTRPTPALTLNDGQNYHPTNKWILFGHHFAAISGAGPLIGPVLAAQFGYLPGLLWILIGVCLAGAVQDFVILGFSMRRNGKSLAQIAFSEIGPFAGTAATIGILFVLVIALAGLGKVVTKALGGDAVTYGPGTQFRAMIDKAGMRHFGASVKDTSSPYWGKYEVGTGSEIEFPNHATQTVTSAFVITITMDDKSRLPGVMSVAHYGDVRVPEGGSAVQAIPGSSWGTFTIAATIPIALFIGFYLYRVRKGRVLEASIIGGVLTLGAVYLGGMVADPNSALNAIFADKFNLTGDQVGYAMAIYGFIASVLPVWLLLCPRDYLSSFLKIGTIALLVIGVVLAHPQLHAPAINGTFLGGGPVLGAGRPVIPFVFITIMCGAVSGFHALVSSGTTPKMISNETDARMIGYGAMLIEGLVGIVALIAATALPVQSYYNINTPAAQLPQYQAQIQDLAKNDRLAGIDEALPDVGEHIEGRTGGAVTLAVGMAKIFNDAIANVITVKDRTAGWMGSLFKYWYHFAIMFEALFILTTIDTGTRVGRFLLQETMGKWVHPKFGKTDWWPSAVLATGLITVGWWYFLNANAFAAIWNMFGVANQMLAVMALAIGTAVLAKNGKKKYVPVTLLPMCVVAITTTWAAVILLMSYFATMQKVGADPAAVTNAVVSAGCLIAILACAAVVVVGAVARIGLKPLVPSTSVVG